MSSVTGADERPKAIPNGSIRGSSPQEVQRTSSRPAGKGRRKRAAAEQRRLELQQLGELSEHCNSSEHNSGNTSPAELAGGSSYDGPRPPGARRQQRRASRRALAAAEAASSREEIEDYFNFTHHPPAHPHSLPGSARHAWAPGRSSSLPTAAEQEDLELALAVSLSLSESGSVHSARAIQRTLQGDLSYENLVNLEDVSLTLAKSQLDSLPIARISSGEAEEVCPICLGEFVEGDSLVSLPCCHSFHQSCGSEWLLNYSRCCPVCKQDVGGESGDTGESSD